MSYKQCIYQRYEINPAQNQIHFFYAFDHTLHLQTVYHLDLSHTQKEGFDWMAFERAVFALGMAELPSYYKLFCPSQIVVEADGLSTEQIAFWKELYQKGLGEFFYKNQIDFRNIINIQAKEPSPSPLKKKKQEKKYLVLYGGGKDSLVSGAFFEEEKIPFTWLEIQTVFASTLPQTHTRLQVIRQLDAQILKLNASGAYNGHVPISSVFAFASVVVGLAQGYTDIVASNEYSANEGNTQYLGMEINHQYSKSFECEKAMAKYIQTFITKQVIYYSLLRPLYEIQITKVFSHYPQYFQEFISCNKGLKTKTWCGSCAKCAFVFTLLSAWLPPQTVTSIFKKNLFEDKNLIPIFEELVGLRACKPFDCVGTKEEMILALSLASSFYETKPIILQIPLERVDSAMITAYSTKHNIPQELQSLFKRFVTKHV